MFIVSPCANVILGYYGLVIIMPLCPSYLCLPCSQTLHHAYYTCTLSDLFKIWHTVYNDMGDRKTGNQDQPSVVIFGPYK